MIQKMNMKSGSITFWRTVNSSSMSEPRIRDMSQGHEKSEGPGLDAGRRDKVLSMYGLSTESSMERQSEDMECDTDARATHFREQDLHRPYAEEEPAELNEYTAKMLGDTLLLEGMQMLGRCGSNGRSRTSKNTD